MAKFKVLLTHTDGDESLDVIRAHDDVHVGTPIRVADRVAVVSNVNPVQFVDEVRGPLDGVVYAQEVRSQHEAATVGLEGSPEPTAEEQA